MEPADVANISFGRTLRRERRVRDLSQQRLAQRAGVSFRHLGEIERGNGNPRLITVVQLIDALGLTLGEFVTSWEEAQRELDRGSR
ncbi:MAG TPA: helix-turn-helix transcriptional regulator [Conexibacter sp.]|jgi:transcriptional regulator with XRE-family HTH domain|nr:helix-turn-helix transcriptional regulator [Conexibacter sp.]